MLVWLTRQSYCSLSSSLLESAGLHEHHSQALTALGQTCQEKPAVRVVGSHLPIELAAGIFEAVRLINDYVLILKSAQTRHIMLAHHELIGGQKNIKGSLVVFHLPRICCWVSA